MKTLDIICPVYCEEAGIAAFHAEMRRTLDALSDRYQSRMIFVLDKSKDKTEEVLRGIAEKDSRVALISLSSRFGHQPSLVAGMDYATADAVVMMDTDLEHPPAVIPRLLEQFEKGYDIVYTVRRYHPGTAFSKRFTSAVYYKLINLLSNIPITPGAADFRLISRKVCEVFKHQFREHNPFLRGLFAWAGFRSAAVEFESDLRTQGVTKYSFKKLVQFAVTGIISFSKRPLRMAIYLGLISAVGALLSVVYSFVVWLENPAVPLGWTTLAILVSFFGGAQLFFMGILGEYLGFVFDEVKGRPLYIVENKWNI